MGRLARTSVSRRTRSQESAPVTMESLESRLLLSAAVAATHTRAGATPASAVKYRIGAWSQGQAGSQYGNTWVNSQYSQAQQFFNRFKNRFTPYVQPTPDPTPDPTPTPDPVPPVTPPTLPPVSITQTVLGNITRLVITGTSDNDSILVSQSGNTFTINANGTTSTIVGNYGELAIYGAGGDDSITVQSSVNIATLLYGGAGSNVLTDHGTAKGYLVTLGAGSDTLTGNGFNTSFWADTTDVVNASSTEIAGGDVHRVAAFYQPFSSTPGTTDYISTSLNGPNLRDPNDSGTTTHLNASLWGTGPTMTDVNQGQVGDCYFLSSIQALAFDQPNKLQELAVDLGDGTYAVQFKRNGVTTYVRVDADMPAASWGGLLYAHPTSGGAIWAAIIEKAYAFFRTAANTYDSLNWGWTGSAFSDLGIATTTFSTSSSSLFNTLTTALANDKSIAAITNGTVSSNVAVVGSHAYTVTDTSVEGGVQYITVRNPWGFDGAGSDSNPSDGLVKLTMSQFLSSFSSGSIST